MITINIPITIGVSILVGILILIIVMFAALDSVNKKVDALTKRFDEHGHNTSIQGGTTYKPVDQKEVSFEQLVTAVQNVQNQGFVNVRAVKGLINAANES